MRGSIKALLEVSLLYALVIGICKVLFTFRSIPFIAQTLPLWAAALFLYIPLLLLFFSHRRPEAWGITTERWRLSLGVLGAFSLLLLPAFVLLYQFYRQWWFHVPAGVVIPPDLPLLITYHLFCVALPEEVFYRGYMQSRLNEAFPGRLRLFGAQVGFGWIYTACLFALGHFLIEFRWESLATFFPGLAFGWMRERTGSLIAPTIFHALCNGTVLLLG